jgi:hypothetical protein
LVICFLVQGCSYCTFQCLQIPHTVVFVSCHTSYNALIITKPVTYNNNEELHSRNSIQHHWVLWSRALPTYQKISHYPLQSCSNLDDNESSVWFLKTPLQSDWGWVSMVKDIQCHSQLDIMADDMQKWTDCLYIAQKSPNWKGFWT